jgi:hypothetical protein
MVRRGVLGYVGMWVFITVVLPIVLVLLAIAGLAGLYLLAQTGTTSSPTTTVTVTTVPFHAMLSVATHAQCPVGYPMGAVCGTPAPPLPTPQAIIDTSEMLCLGALNLATWLYGQEVHAVTGRY